MKEGKFLKKYDALICGIPSPEEGFIIAPIARECEGNIKRVVRDDGKFAKTYYKVIKKLEDGNSLCEITLFTGRTHQIRVHMAHIGYPLLGDFLYGEKIEGAEYKLHAKSITFPHPHTGEMLNITCDGGL